METGHYQWKYGGIVAYSMIAHTLSECSMVGACADYHWFWHLVPAKLEAHVKENLFFKKVMQLNTGPNIETAVKKVPYAYRSQLRSSTRRYELAHQMRGQICSLSKYCMDGVLRYEKPEEETRSMITKWPLIFRVQVHLKRKARAFHM